MSKKPVIKKKQLSVLMIFALVVLMLSVIFFARHYLNKRKKNVT